MKSGWSKVFNCSNHVIFSIGDVILNDLVLRNSALDDMNVPFRIVVGKLGMRYVLFWFFSFTQIKCELLNENFKIF